MARTPEGRLLTETHRKQQLVLRAAVLRDVVKLWPIWNPRDTATYEMFVSAVVLLVQSRAVNSSAIAARYYEMFRAADAPGLTPGKAVAVPVLLAAAPVEAEIRAAVSSTARAGTYRALGAGQPYAAAMRTGLVLVSGAVTREVMNAGRDTILEAVRQDPQALGWARVTGSNPCPFCIMLAGRGPVYKDESVDFEAHDHDTCTAEPAYEGSEWPGQAREYRAKWDEATAGFSREDALRAFRSSLSE